MSTKYYTCPVCYYNRLEELPANWSICPSCGSEFEVFSAEDYPLVRQEWIDGGRKWWSDSDKMDTIFSVQYDQPINEVEVPYNTPEMLTVWSLPKKLAFETIEDDANLFLEHVALTPTEIKDEANKLGASSTSWIDQNTVLCLKETRILKAIVNLYAKIYAKYKAVAEALGIELNADNFCQEIFIDVMYRDLMPGDTSISFEIYTRRRLVRSVTKG